VAESDDTFLSRWSKRKAQLRQTGVEAPVEVPAEVPVEAPQPAPTVLKPSAVAPAVASPAIASDAAARATHQVTPTPTQRLPTLDDVAKLTADSDFSAFAAKGVDAVVRNAAMRKLFHSVPSFNVQDGLDVYIDDYSNLPLLPRAQLREMMQARFLGLLDDEVVDQGLPPSATPTATTLEASAATSSTQDLVPHEPSDADDPKAPLEQKPAHENPDLQLQSNHAAERDSAARSAVADPGHPVEPEHKP
jgi:hypothetical protein